MPVPLWVVMDYPDCNRNSCSAIYKEYLMQLPSGMEIGFVGLGLMGEPMARNLRRAGARVVVSNRSSQVVERLAAEGFATANSPSQAAGQSDIVVCMVSDTDAVEQVLFGTSGIIEGARAGTVVVDMGTSEVGRTRLFASRLARAGIEFADAPVSGGQIGAQEASLSIMVGASEAIFDRLQPVLGALGRNIVHVGGIGSGQIAKAANQIIVGLTISAVAEALALAKRGGADIEKVRQALDTGFASSTVLKVHGQRMISADYKPGGKAETQRKDLHQALVLARSLGIRLPATQLCLNQYDTLIEQGGKALDHSALFKLY